MTTETTPAQKISFFRLLVGVIIRPRQTLTHIAEQSSRAWIVMALLAFGAVILPILVAAPITTRQIEENLTALQEGGLPFEAAPPGASEQAVQIATSPLITTVFPTVAAVLGLIIGWLIWGGALHLGAMITGGRNTFRQVIQIVVWSWLPFSLRGFLQSIVILVTGKLIANPGLSGFVANDQTMAEVIATPPSTGNLVLQALLGRLDLFLLWNLALLIIGVGVAARFSNRKAIGLTLIVWVALTLLSLLPVVISGALATSFTS